ncbi:MAG: hypothetical protein AVDCRST_MAG93-4597, partial [uncultured Chloroflexia bacterium]
VSRPGATCQLRYRRTRRGCSNPRPVSRPGATVSM